MKTTSSVLKTIIIIGILSLQSCKDDEPTRQNQNPGEFTITVKDITRSEAKINWTASTDPDGDTISYDIRMDEETVIEGLSDSKYTLQDLASGTEHTVAVTANDGNGGSQVQTSSFNTVVNQPPAEPTVISPKDSETTDKTNITFEFEASKDPEEDEVVYDLRIQPTGGGEVILIAENITKTTFTYEGTLALSTNYRCIIAAKDSYGAEAMSSVLFTTRGPNVEMRAATLTPRSYHSAGVYEGEMVVMGGYGGVGIDEISDAQSSTGGLIWTSINSVFEPRRFHASLVYEDKIWLLGGEGSHTIYTLSGLSGKWEQQGGGEWSIGYLVRYSAVVFNDKMYVIGGIADSNSSAVYSSTDGISWELENSSAEFGARYSHTSVVFDNKIWVIGGTTSISSSDKLNDVWYSEDGSAWTQATSEAAFLARHVHSSVVYDNKMWVLGGLDNNSDKSGELWYSTDGITWEEASIDFEGARYAAQMLVKDGAMFVLGGLDESGYTGDILKIN